MKKILFTATMVVSFSAFFQAQQRGVGVNTTSPASTLDVVANTTDNAMPDAVLVPRMTEDQLAAKNAAYAAGQNGALVFVTAVDGSTTAKTVNVTAVGFYYYDNPTSTWKALGGGAVSTPALNVTSQSNSYSALPTDDIILYTTTAPATLTLPTTGVPIGKKIFVSVIGSADVALSPAVRETANVNLITGQANILMYTGGTGNGSWSIISGY